MNSLKYFFYGLTICYRVYWFSERSNFESNYFFTRPWPLGQAESWLCLSPYIFFFMMNDGWWMIDKGWWMMDDEWRMKDDRWWMLDGGWWMMDDGWWMMDYGWWIMDDGWWMMDDGADILREGLPPPTCHMSCVACPMSCITSYKLLVPCHMSHFFWQIGEACLWRVCYQRSQPPLGIFKFKLPPPTTK